MDERSRYLDNIFIERLWRSLKQEAIYLYELQDGFQAERVIRSWISFYNADRPHTALEKRTPDEAYFNLSRMEKRHEKHPEYILTQPQTCSEKQDHSNHSYSME